MKFVDEAVIDIAAGNGGAGCMSFRREKCIPFGGPNGGNGGKGGSVWFVGDRNLNTLIDYRYNRRHEARNGEAGRGSDQRGSVTVLCGLVWAGLDLLITQSSPGQSCEISPTTGSGRVTRCSRASSRA